MDQQTQVAETAPPRWHAPARVVGFVGTSLLVGSFPSFSLRSTLTMIGLGGAFFWLGVSRRMVRHPVVRHIGREAVWWIVPVVMFASFELVNFALGSTPAHPTLSALADPVLQHYWARSAVFLGWITGFWALVRR
ncbi:hypothetical protein [Actinocatenispora rupis]|uniref:Uncharacterized protein n=1 Tax=Actinocatenispora rupis TaxID=519421 RepID=A0A8J3IUV2_9ACTN|nr:hypothetical protein [Actinocatenispora rupis]GID09188.1 hypothetical protein Aru02nite_00770 [Actinocatenispora rupis]